MNYFLIEGKLYYSTSREEISDRRIKLSKYIAIHLVE